MKLFIEVLFIITKTKPKKHPRLERPVFKSVACLLSEVITSDCQQDNSDTAGAHRTGQKAAVRGRG